MSALTGVGPSIASGSHVCSGTCADFATAPPRSPSATRLMTSELEPPISWSDPKLTEPVCRMSRNSASAIVASPNALTMNAFFAAAIALGRSWWKPINRYDERPTRPQPTSSISRLPPCTSSNIEKTKNAM